MCDIVSPVMATSAKTRSPQLAVSSPPILVSPVAGSGLAFAHQIKSECMVTPNSTNPRCQAPFNSKYCRKIYPANAAAIHALNSPYFCATGIMNSASSPYLKQGTPAVSPYANKSYSSVPPSPLGISPIFRTPIRTTGQVSSSPVLPNAKTPVGLQPPTCNKYVTPQSRQIINPFEAAMLERLHLPVFFSPGLFAKTSTPGSDDENVEKPFRWSIDQMSSLHPVEIDEMASCNHLVHLHDQETEALAQKAIDEFFASHSLIAPSPWSGTGVNGISRLPQTPAAYTVMPHPSLTNLHPHLAHAVIARSLHSLTINFQKNTGYGSSHPTSTIYEGVDLEGSIKKELPQQKRTVDASCQTSLTMPTNFDLQNVLGEFMTYHDLDEDVSQEMLSTSSLRRKLFFQGDLNSPSPVKKSIDVLRMQYGEDGVSPQVSPLKSAAIPPWPSNSIASTPASEHFSSSPISAARTPHMRRVSSDNDLIASPELSPIGTPARHAGKAKRSCSALSSPMLPLAMSHGSNSPFTSHDDLGSSPIYLPNRHQCRDLFSSPDVSPIHMNRHTSHRSVIQSPHMSPIPSMDDSAELDNSKNIEVSSSPTPSMSDVRQRLCLDVDDEEEEDMEHAKKKDSDPHSLTTEMIPGTSALAVFNKEELSPVRPFAEIFTHHNDDLSMDDTMELDPRHIYHSTQVSIPHSTILMSSDPPNDSGLATHGNYCNLSTTYSEFTNQDSNEPSGQDTGYQTGSLQLTQHETGSQHTNLTTHFLSMPFRSTIETDTMDEGYSNLSDRDSNTQMFSSINGHISKQAFIKERLDSSQSNWEILHGTNIQSGSSTLKGVIFKERLGLNYEDSNWIEVRQHDGVVKYESTEKKMDNVSHDAVVARAKQLLGLGSVTEPSTATSASLPQCDMYSVQNMSHQQATGMTGIHGFSGQHVLSPTSQKPDLAEFHTWSHADGQLPSQLAKSILQRAGEDLAKYTSSQIQS